MNSKNSGIRIIAVSSYLVKCRNNKNWCVGKSCKNALVLLFLGIIVSVRAKDPVYTVTSCDCSDRSVNSTQSVPSGGNSLQSYARNGNSFTGGDAGNGNSSESFNKSVKSIASFGDARAAKANPIKEEPYTTVYDDFGKTHRMINDSAYLLLSPSELIETTYDPAAGNSTVSGGTIGNPPIGGGTTDGLWSVSYLRFTLDPLMIDILNDRSPAMRLTWVKGLFVIVGICMTISGKIFTMWFKERLIRSRLVKE